MSNLAEEKDTYIISNKHIRRLDNIFRQYEVSAELQKQVLDWAAFVLSEEQKEWQEMRANSVEVLCNLDRKAEARRRAAAKNKKYEKFKKVFKQLQEQQFQQYQKKGMFLSASTFVKWFLQNKPKTLENPYVKSNQINQMTKLAQANNREFKISCVEEIAV